MNPPVLVTLGKTVENRGWKQKTFTIKNSVMISLAMHDPITCMMRGYSPHHKDNGACVILWKGCNYRSIIRIIVHETRHHVLQWLFEDEFDQYDSFIEKKTGLPSYNAEQKLGIF